MTKEEKRSLNPEIVFVSRELGIPKKWLWYLIENDLETFSKFADLAENIDEGVVEPPDPYDVAVNCSNAYDALRKLTDDIKWIADAYKTDKKEPFPMDAFETVRLIALAKEKA